MMLRPETAIKAFGPSGPPSGLSDLLSYIKSFCHDHGIRVELKDADSVDSGDGVPCSGYFEATERVLAVAIGKSIHKWLPVLLHEFSHAKQYMEDSAWFDKASDSEAVTFEWAYHNRPMTRSALFKHLKLCIELERDCEIRTIDLIKKFKISNIVSPTDYARKANAYLYFWRYFADTKVWYEKGNPPYEQKALYDQMPGEIQKSYMRMPKAVREAFRDNMARRQALK